MGERRHELVSVLAGMRRRWVLTAGLRAWTAGAGAAALLLLATAGALAVAGGQGLGIASLVALASLAAIITIVVSLRPLARRPTDRQLARFIEERAGGFDDVLVTAVDCLARPPGGSVQDLLVTDAARALAALDADAVIPSAAIRRAAFSATAASLALAAGVYAIAPWTARAAGFATAYLFPATVTIEVVPGSARVREGGSLVVTARVPGQPSLVPVITVGDGDAARSLDMAPSADGFTVTLSDIRGPFPYRVSAGGARSPVFEVTIARPPRVERIDLHYTYPGGLAPRREEDGGDIYAPAGSTVRLTVTADRPVERGWLTLSDGARVPLAGGALVLDGALRIARDDSYRVALVDRDGLENPGETEYFIRMVDDRPPDVRILRPAADRPVTPLEEVRIEARADDDYGIEAFELVFQTPDGREQVVPLAAPREAHTATGAHTLHLEDLHVRPGDFVSYFARARDVSRARRGVEARSDIFFLDVKPFEEEFVVAQSQAAGGGGQNTDLVEAQKAIIVATWKLDARRQRARDARSNADIRAVAAAQQELRVKVEEASGGPMRVPGPPRRRAARPAPGGDDPLARAAAAMGRAAGELDRLRTASALPHEREALNELLKAEAENRRRQVARQTGGGGGQSRAGPDLSTLFDQELRRRQQTNYETPSSAETREDEASGDDALDRIRELARRQQELNRELNRRRDATDEEELKRELARLTREQQELQRQVDDLARRMQPSGQQSGRQSPQPGGQPRDSAAAPRPQTGGQPSGQGQSGSRDLREVSEAMRQAASGMRQADQASAAAGGERALERLRALERGLQAARPDDRRRALADLQLEARQMADAERRLGNEAARSQAGAMGDDARRRLAGEQERLAERAERLQDAVRGLSRELDGQAVPDDAERRALAEAARDLDRQQLAERMRAHAGELRQADGAVAKGAEDLARALDRVGDQLGTAAGARDREARRLSEELGRAQQLRERLADIERSIEALQQAAGEKPAAAGNRGQPSTDGQPADRQRELAELMRDAERLAGELGRDHPGLQPGAGATPEAWMPSVAAPGTEAFKQDFARWESLKAHLLLALEQVERELAGALRARESRERLNAGRHDAVPESYREQVEKYYKSLASPRRPRP